MTCCEGVLRNFSEKISFLSEDLITIFSCLDNIGAPEMSMELTASNSRARHSCDGSEK